MKRFSKFLSIMLILALMVPGLVFAEKTNSNLLDVEIPEHVDELEKDEYERVIKAFNEKFEKQILEGEPGEVFEKDQIVRIIVELEEDPIIKYATKEGVKYEKLSVATIDKLERNIETQQAIVKDSILSNRIEMNFLRDYNTVFNGFSGKVKFGDIPLIENLPQVKDVYIANEYERPEIKPDMGTSTGMIDAGSAWAEGFNGEGTVIAIIDTGIDPSHKDMILTNPDKGKLKETDIVDVPGKYFTPKVPYGYNYYDLNNEILDLGPGASEHGMHVAGSAGANGNPEEGGVKGVAPEAQLLAMKVFSNDPIYATTFSDIYLAAIEDAVKLGIDALNMSLGSSAAFYIPNSPEDRAITNAVENGIVCAVSAGNSSQITDGWTETYYGFPWKQNPDIGVVGSPGLNKDTIQVASIENTHMRVPYLFYDSDVVADVLPSNSVIVEDKAYDIRWLNNNEDAQMHLIGAYSEGKEIYVKLSENVIVDIKGNEISEEELPTVVIYYDANGEQSKRTPLSNGEATLPTSGKIPMTVAGNIDPTEVFDGAVEIVDGGSGHPDEYAEDVEGKIVLAIRGGKTGPFTEKIENAQAAGAAGIIVYNHEAGGEGLINMATPDVQTIPAVFIGHNGGKTLLSLEEKYVSFASDTIPVPNPDAWDMSSFSSWGATPSLELKPEITAPGGQIYSTLQNNSYGMMSGTSMASPHVAGGSAVVMQYIKGHEEFSQLSPSKQTRLAKVLLMNTAELIEDPNGDTYFSPRRQGAGLMKVNSAINTPVRIVNTSTGEAKVELGDFEETSFTMNFKAINHTKEDVSYDINVDLLADEIYPLGDVELNLLAARDMDFVAGGDKEITVPANGEKEFTVTVDFSGDADIYRNMFVEGFVTLVEKTDNHPSLSVPYVGFYGDWNEPQILDGMLFLDEEGESYFESSGMVNLALNGKMYFYDEKIYMSPSTIGGLINGNWCVIPVPTFMRNAEKVEYNILEKDGDLLRRIHTEDYVRKNLIDGGRRSPYRIVKEALWNGKVNNKFVPDGEYLYEIKAKTHYDGEEWQSRKYPIYVDVKPPIIEELKYDFETGMLTWKASDDGSGLLGYMIDVNEEEVEVVMIEDGDEEEFAFNLAPYIEADGEYQVDVYALDKALNMKKSSTSVSTDNVAPYIYLLTPDLLETLVVNEVEFLGAVVKNNDLKSVKVDGKEAEFEFNNAIEIKDGDKILYKGPGYVFTHTLNLEDGYHQISVEAESMQGTTANIVRRFWVDSTPPELELELLDREAGSDKAEIKVKMKDNYGYLKLLLGDSVVFEHDGMEGYEMEPSEEEVIITVDLKEGDNVFEFKLFDFGTHWVTEKITITK